MSRRIAALALLVAVGIVASIGIALGTTAQGPTASADPTPALSRTASPTPTPTPSPSPMPTPTPSPTATPAPTPSPTPAPVAAPLSGRPVTAAEAAHRVMAVMVDDHSGARPQAGFNAASVVWHAPAEGGIPRYMLLFQERIPGLVGPVRSVRPYYLAWAAEWRAMLVHVGGSPEALRTLRDQGQGELVWDADEFRWGGIYLWRSRDRFAPHNVYTDGEHLRAMAERLGADDAPIDGSWRFALDPPLARRPDGGTIEVPYLANEVAYRYDRRSNRYVRSVREASPQVDVADGKPVAPKNVVVLFVPFRPADDGQPEKLRLDAQVLGEGRALIATNGVTIEGTWRKDALTSPTLLFDSRGRPAVLTVGQTFVQVVPVDADVDVTPGTAVPRPRGPSPR